LLVGVPGRSNAFAIAERLGLPKSLIDAARGHVTEEGQRVESMIATLESNRISTEAERASAEQLKKEAEQIRKKLTDDQQKFGEQRDRLVAKAQQEAREIIAKAKQEAVEVIAELRKMALEEQASVKEHKLIEAKRRLDQASPGLQVVKHSVPVNGNRSQADIQAGDEVQVPHLKQKGHVVELASETEALVQIGVMKLKIRKDELELIKHKETNTIKTSGASLKRTRDENVRLELDLRGNNLEEALIEVDRFLDEAYLSGLGQVQIIHGKGTGVLRSGIQDYMKRHKHIKQYRLGNYGEGGTGVTVVELK
jgi:DNA mismatch repair protein MutS2